MYNREGESWSFSSEETAREVGAIPPPLMTTNSASNSRSSLSITAKRRKNSPCSPGMKRGYIQDPSVPEEVIALSPKTLMAPKKLICKLCNRTFVRDQNLRLHMRGHSLPWTLKKRRNAEDEATKKIYICPEISCPRHDSTKALRDPTGIRKHFSRKHSEKKLSCNGCSKKYAVLSDLKAHLKICSTKLYKCGCGENFARKDGFFNHKTFCNGFLKEDKDEMEEPKPKTISSIGCFQNYRNSELINSSYASGGDEDPSVIKSTAPKLLSLLLNPTSMEAKLSVVSDSLLGPESPVSSSSHLLEISDLDTYYVMPSFRGSITHRNLAAQSSVGFEINYHKHHQVPHLINGLTALTSMPSPSFDMMNTYNHSVMHEGLLMGSLKCMVQYSKADSNVPVPLPTDDTSITGYPNRIMEIKGEKAKNLGCREGHSALGFMWDDCGTTLVDLLGPAERSRPMISTEEQQNQK